MSIVAKALAASIQINTNLPGTNPSSSGIQGFVANFYTFALIIAGILAFGAIVWGGIKYAVGGGNPTSESEGKSWITGALLGLLLLGGAWIILTTVNPQITTLQIAGLPTLSPAPAPTPGPAPTTCTGGTTVCGTNCCTATQTCQLSQGNVQVCVNPSPGPAQCGFGQISCGTVCCAQGQLCNLNNTGQLVCG